MHHKVWKFQAWKADKVLQRLLHFSCWIPRLGFAMEFAQVAWVGYCERDPFFWSPWLKHCFHVTGIYMHFILWAFFLSKVHLREGFSARCKLGWDSYNAPRLSRVLARVPLISGWKLHTVIAPLLSLSAVRSTLRTRDAPSVRSLWRGCTVLVPATRGRVRLSKFSNILSWASSHKKLPIGSCLEEYLEAKWDEVDYISWAAFPALEKFSYLSVQDYHRACCCVWYACIGRLHNFESSAVYPYLTILSPWRALSPPCSPRLSWCICTLRLWVYHLFPCTRFALLVASPL